jgi:hypothetical protein
VRRIVLVLAVAALMVVMICASVLPAFAQAAAPTAGGNFQLLRTPALGPLPEVRLLGAGAGTNPQGGQGNLELLGLGNTSIGPSAGLQSPLGSF